MSWLSDRWGKGGVFGWAGDTAKRNRNAIGDVVKYGSAIAAPFTGPLAPWVAGLGAAAGTGIHEGTNIGDIGKAGAIGAGTGYLGAKVGKMFGAGGSSGEGGATMASLGFDAGDDAAGAAASTLSKQTPSLLRSAGNAAWEGVKDIGSWAAKHPETVGQGIKSLADAPANEAQTRRLALLNQQDEYSLAKQKERDKAMNPIWQALAGQAQGFMNNRGPVAPNPYSR